MVWAARAPKKKKRGKRGKREETRKIPATSGASKRDDFGPRGRRKGARASMRVGLGGRVGRVGLVVLRVGLFSLRIGLFLLRTVCGRQVI